MSRRTVLPFLAMYFIVTAMMVVSPSYADTNPGVFEIMSSCKRGSDVCRMTSDGKKRHLSPVTCHTPRETKQDNTVDVGTHPNPLSRGDGETKQGDTAIDAPKKAHIQASFGKFPLYFIQNNGQVDKKVKFYEQGNGHAMFFTGRGVYLSFAGRSGGRGERREARNQRSEDRNQKQGARGTMQDAGCKIIVDHDNKSKIASPSARNDRNPQSKIQNTKHKTLNFKPETCSSKSAIRNPQSAIVRLFPLGGNKHPEIVAEGLQAGKVNYLTGNDPSKWKSNIPTYNAVVYKEVYKGIDIKFYGNNQQLEYDIIVKAGANPSRVRFAYEGIDGMRVTDEGDLEISVNGGKLVQKKPHIYQEINGRRWQESLKFMD